MGKSDKISINTLFHNDLLVSHNPMSNLTTPSAVIIPGPKVMTWDEEYNHIYIFNSYIRNHNKKGGLMPFTNYALDRIVSQQFSQLTQCNAEEIISHFPHHKLWVTNFILNSTFGGSVTEEERTFSFFFLRRSEAAFEEYEYGRQALNDFINLMPRSPSLYFKALNHFEMVISMLWQAFDMDIKRTNVQRFVKGDGSTYQRLNFIYNHSRHFYPSDISSGFMHAVWLTNNGMNTGSTMITYTEIVGFLTEIGNISEGLQNA